MDFVLRTFRGEGRGGVTQTPHKRVNFHRINPLEEGVAPAIQVPRPGSQLKCPAKRLFRCIGYSGVFFWSHPFFPVVQLIGLQYSVLGATLVWWF